MAEERFCDKYRMLLYEYNEAGLRDHHLLIDYLDTKGNEEKFYRLTRDRIAENEARIEMLRREREEKFRGKERVVLTTKNQEKALSGVA